MSFVGGGVAFLLTVEYIFIHCLLTVRPMFHTLV